METPNACAAARSPAATAITAIGLCLALTPSLHAQGSVHATVAPTFGALDPSGSVPFAPILDERIHIVDYNDMEAMLALGIDVDVGLRDLPLSARLSGRRSSGGDKTGRWGCLPAVDGGPAGCPSILILLDTDVTVSTLSGSIVGDVPIGPLRLHPGIGGALVRYSYQWDPSPVGSFSLAPGEAKDDVAALHLLAGASVPVGPLRVRGEYGYLISGGDPVRAHPKRLNSFGIAIAYRLGS